MKLFFNVARHHYCIEFLDNEAPYKQLIPSHAPFVEKEPDAPLLFHLSVGDGLVETSLEGLDPVGEFDSGNGKNQVARLPEGGFRILIHDISGQLAACFESNADFSKCKVACHGNLTSQHFGLDNSIMIAFAFSGAYHNMLLMHSSVPVKDNRGYLFLGKSGTGKSTHCELWLKHISDTIRINDDNPVVFVETDGTPWVFGSPWSGKTPIYMNVGAPIGGFLQLHQAPKNEIRLLHKLEGFASILSSCSTMIWDKPSYDGICDTISKVIAAVDCYVLNCLPDRDAAIMSYTTMHHPNE